VFFFLINAVGFIIMNMNDYMMAGHRSFLRSRTPKAIAQRSRKA